MSVIYEECFDIYIHIYMECRDKQKEFIRISYKLNKRPNIVLTPNAKDESGELRKVMVPARWWSEYKSDQNTKYKDIVAIYIAWTVDMPLHTHSMPKL